jgi:hypothetical protein
MVWRTAAIFVCLMVAVAGTPTLVCQSNNGGNEIKRASAREDFLNVIEEERKTGATLFYRQSYIDSTNKLASYRGSVYGAIQSAKLDGCSLTMDILIVDLFSGTAGKKSVENMQDTETYRIDFILTREIAGAMTLVEARPLQLKRNTNSMCTENSSCTFTWLQVQAKAKVIKETRTTNNFVDFDGYVNRFLIPLSSPDAGKQFINQVKALVDGDCR